MLKFLLVSLLLFTSCSSFSKAKWKHEGVAVEKQEWRRCSADKDGAEFSEKGYCYIQQECRKRFLRKKECRRKQLFCKYGDVECQRKNKYPLIKRGV